MGSSKKGMTIMGTQTITTSADELVDAFQRITATERAELAHSMNGVYLRGARLAPIGNSPNATARPATSAGALVGYSINNTGGAAVTVRIFVGPDANGSHAVSLSIPANTSKEAWLGPAGISYDDTGLFITTSAATIEGALYLRSTEL